MKKKVLIEGMTCENCVRHATEALSELNGVSNVEVKLEEKYALINVESNVTDTDIEAAIDEVGYEVVKIEVL